ncbi:hypothetical protein Q3G72_026072 [Acer saccharum]|nr:hypothetical protein Q3G72_026072 [Acer saccharum]
MGTPSSVDESLAHNLEISSESIPLSSIKRWTNSYTPALETRDRVSERHKEVFGHIKKLLNYQQSRVTTIQLEFNKLDRNDSSFTITGGILHAPRAAVSCVNGAGDVGNLMIRECILDIKEMLLSCKPRLSVKVTSRGSNVAANQGVQSGLVQEAWV